MPEKLRWGILGTGKIARIFARAVATSVTGELVAVGSRTQTDADAFGRSFNTPQCCGSYDAVLTDPTVQAIYIALPNHLHCEWTVKCAQAAKHILCEKPAATNHPELMVMMEAVRGAGVFFMEAFMYRCARQTCRLVELIQEGAIGEVRTIQAQFSYDMGGDPDYTNIRLRNDTAGGSIMDIGCYTVSMARLIAGAAHGRDFEDPIEVKGFAHIGDRSRVDEWATAVLLFPGDIQALLACGTRVAIDSTVRIWGTEGSIVVPNPWTPGIRRWKVDRIIVHPKGHAKPRKLVVRRSAQLYVVEVDTVAKAIFSHQAYAPCMAWQDTLGQQQTLDRWRYQVGLVFDREKSDADTLKRPFSGKPLTVQRDHRMIYGEIEGVGKRISRIVLGTTMLDIDHAPRGCALLDHFWESGGTAFDSAHVYGGGNCERALGQWIKSRGIRDQAVVLGKGGHSPHCTPQVVTEQLFQTLDRLQIDYLDLYCLHRDDPNVPVGEFVDVLNEHHRAGRIGAFGGSNWTIPRIEAANKYAAENGRTGFKLASNNLCLSRWNEPVSDGCESFSDPDSRAWLRERQLPNFAWSSQASGFFTGRFTGGPYDPPSTIDVVRVWSNEDNFKRLERAMRLGNRTGTGATQVALAWVLAQPFPSYACIGPCQIEEIRTSLLALDISLTPAEVEWLALEREEDSLQP